MKNMNQSYVWDMVPRPKDKSVVTSKWLYKIKHEADGSVEYIRPGSLLEASLKRKESTMTRYLHQFPDIPLSNLLLLLLPLKDGAYIKWMLRLLSYMAILRRKSTCNNLRGSKFKIEGHVYAGQRNPSMG